MTIPAGVLVVVLLAAALISGTVALLFSLLVTGRHAEACLLVVVCSLGALVALTLP